MKNQTDSDRKVTLLLALMMAKANEGKRLFLFLQTNKVFDYASAQADVTSLSEARERCDAEVSGWLEHRVSDRAALESGPCLAEALQAAAIVGL
jgi:hypothetical protein